MRLALVYQFDNAKGSANRMWISGAPLLLFFYVFLSS